jgi:hypothetical protein
MHLPPPALPLAAAWNERPQATDPIVDFAVLRRRPFAVVPCCVFARQFTDRRTADGGRVTTQAAAGLPAGEAGVRLPFSGANVLLYQTHYP